MIGKMDTIPIVMKMTVELFDVDNKKDANSGILLFFSMCALRRTFLTGESPQSALVVGRIQPRPRVSTVRWNLKEGGGKSLV